MDSGRGLSLDFDTDDYDTLSEPNLVGVGGAQNDIPSEIPRPYSSSAVLEHSEASQEPEAHSTGEGCGQMIWGFVVEAYHVLFVL